MMLNSIQFNNNQTKIKYNQPKYTSNGAHIEKLINGSPPAGYQLINFSALTVIWFFRFLLLKIQGVASSYLHLMIKVHVATMYKVVNSITLLRVSRGALFNV